MDPNIDLDEVLDKMIDEELEDNNNEEIIRLILESQQQLDGNTTRRRQRRRVVHWNCEEGHDRLFNDYFSANLVFNNHDEYFQMRVDALRRKGLSPLQKCTTALRILAYGSLADSVDEYVLIGDQITKTPSDYYKWSDT
ncbi:hypothetical protein JHK82_025205 [Glycine max]|nr:hypothetical protein JHK82_025205 [Glycine max]